MMVIGIIIEILFIVVGMIAIPLCYYISHIENGNSCRECINANNCLAQRPFRKGRTNWVDEWMLISFLCVSKQCNYEEKKKSKYYCLYIVTALALLILIQLNVNDYLKGTIYSISTISLLALSIVDWNTQYIPMEYTCIILLCGLIRLMTDISNWWEYILGLIMVSGFLYIVNKIAAPILRNKYDDDSLDDVIGDGDMKLMAATGLLLGWKLNLIALGIGCVIGSIIQIILMKVKGSDRQFALGPYLSLGVYITMICGEQLVSWYLNMIGIVPM